MPRPRATPGPDSRARLIAAATEEFAAHGLAGASLDRIARRARVTKAMVYYHFAGKDALYREIIRGAFAAVGARVGARPSAPGRPLDRMRAFVAAFVDEALRRPHFPRMVMRELSESGRHFDAETARAWVAVPEAFFAILHDGVARGEFRPVHPLVALLATIGPVVLVLASAPTRQRVARLLGRALPDIDATRLSAAAQAVTVAVLTAVDVPSDSRSSSHDSHPTPVVADRRARPRGARRRRVS
jgi:TetR/AcrR family transcriptional regulator